MPARDGPGLPLPSSLAGALGRGFGVPVDHVRLHTGPASAEAAAALGAQAFALGPDIHFGAGTYDPGSSAGQHLIAHEVAHTLQAPSTGPRTRPIEIGASSDAEEQSADRAADVVMAGGTDAAGLLGTSAAPRLRRSLRVPLAGLGSMPLDHSFAILERATAINWDHGRNVSESNWWGTLARGREPERPVNIRAGNGGVIVVELSGRVHRQNLMYPDDGGIARTLRWDYTSSPQGVFTTLTPRPQEIHDDRNEIALVVTTQEDTAHGVIRIVLAFTVSGTTGTVGGSAEVASVSSGATNISGSHTYTLALRANWMGTQAAPQPTPQAEPRVRAAPVVRDDLNALALFQSRGTRLDERGLTDLNHWIQRVEAVPDLGDAVRSGLVPIHVLGAASAAGHARANVDYAQGRVEELQVLLSGRLGRSGHSTGGLLGGARVRYEARAMGELLATPPHDLPLDRYGAVQIRADEAVAGILQLLRERDGGGAAPDNHTP